METEEWRTCVYDGVTYDGYEVSTWGRVRHKNSQELKRLTVLKTGYVSVSIGRSCFVHRLVAFTWIPNDNPTIKKTVNHKDHNRQNNHVDNLEWLSNKNNVRNSKGLRNYKIRCIETGEIFDTLIDASLQKLGLFKDYQLSQHLQGKRENVCGLHFEYVDSEELN